MDILGLVFPTSFFEQNKQQKSLETSDSRTEFSVVASVSRFMKNTKDTSQGIKSQKHHINGSSKKPYGVLDDLSKHSSATSELSGIVSTSSNGNEPVKGKSKKKKKKKGKRNTEKLSVHNENAPEVGNMDLQTTTTQRSSTKIPLSIGLTECDSNQRSKEVISKSLHDMDGVKHKNACFGPEASKYILDTNDDECLCSNLSSVTSVLQDRGFGHKKVDKTFNTMFSVKQHEKAAVARNSAPITSITECNAMAALLEDLRFWETKSVNPSLHSTGSDVDLITLRGGYHISTESCQERPNLANIGWERFSVTENEVIIEYNDQKTGKNIEEPCSRSQLIRSVPCIAKLEGSLGAKEAYNHEIRSSNHCTKVANDPVTARIENILGVTEAKSVTNQELTISNQCYASSDAPAASIQISGHGIADTHISDNKQWVPSHMNNRKKFGKENNHFGKKSNVGNAQTHGRKNSDHNHLWTVAALPEKTTSFKDSFSGEEDFLPHSHVTNSYKNHSQQKAENLGICSQKTGIFAKSSERDGQECFYSRYGQYKLRSLEENAMGNRTSERSKHKVNQPFKQEGINNWRKVVWVSKGDQCKSRIRPSFSCREALRIPKTEYLSRSNFAGKRSYYCNCDDNRKTEYFEAYKVERLPYFCHTERPWDKNIESFASRGKMWVPVGKKDPIVLKTSKNVDAIKIREEECLEEMGRDASNLEASVIDVTEYEQKHNGLHNDEREKHIGERKCGIFSASDNLSKNLPIYIGSELAVRTLDDSYKLQIACEDIQLTTGIPIAEFEKLLNAASPVITPTIQRHCEDVLMNEPITTSFSKFQKSSILLQDVWCWYERPGNYGLEVKAEDCKNSELSESDISFCAYFVPSLSAIQLFGHSHHLSGSSQANSTNTEQFSCPSPPSDISCTSCPGLVAKKTMRLCVPATSDGNGSCNLASSVYSDDDAYMIFEFFEHEPPQQRKPLVAKIKELVEVGSSSPHTFGDLSKLKLTNLQDLHPASWFSVAWYPIYRIPEGRLRASFLTYHSLGHLFPRDIKPNTAEENAFCVVLPVLGLQSYNAQGESWFYSKKQDKPLLKDGEPVDISALPKERLRTLEEAAAVFARGHVRKGHVMVPNRQPDYEFFLSRKQ